MISLAAEPGEGWPGEPGAKLYLSIPPGRVLGSESPAGVGPSLLPGGRQEATGLWGPGSYSVAPYLSS